MTFIDYDSADHLRTAARTDLSQTVSAVDDVVTIKAADGGSQMRLGAHGAHADWRVYGNLTT